MRFFQLETPRSGYALEEIIRIPVAEGESTPLYCLALIFGVL